MLNTEDLALLPVSAKLANGSVRNKTWQKIVAFDEESRRALEREV